MDLPRVLTFDGGCNLGFGALGGGREPVAGSFLLKGGPFRMGALMRDADQHIRRLILQERPDAIGFATPFVGQVWRFNKEKTKKFAQPIAPENIRPLYGVIAKVEEIADELHIRCIEEDEGRARMAFLGGVPRKSRDIKQAVMNGCADRNWKYVNNHGADALCVGSYILELLVKSRSHEQTPLFHKETSA